nr:MAG TPA: Baseplate structural protein [Caudoviricetes sp.]
MALVNKPDESIFASSAKQGEVDNFPDLLRGWGITFDQTQGIPPMEWFNFLFKRLDEKHAYLMQRGLPEWSATQDYTKGSCVQFDGVSYRALKDSKNNRPNESNSQYWVRWGFALSEIAQATLTQYGITKLYTGYDSQSEDLALTPKTAYQIKQLIDSNTRALGNVIPNSKKSSAVNSNSADTVATSAAVKTAYDKGVEAKNAADNAQRTANDGVSKADAAQRTANDGVSKADAANNNANSRVSKSGDRLTGILHTVGIASTHFGQGGYSSQYASGAPFMVEATGSRDKDTYHPFIKGLVRSRGRYGAGFSFGYTTKQGNGDGFGRGIINLIEDNGTSKNWGFEHNGDFYSAGDVRTSSGKSINDSVQTSAISHITNGTAKNKVASEFALNELNKKLSTVIRKNYTKTIKGTNASFDNATQKNINLEGETIIHPDGKIEQIIHFKAFRVWWFYFEAKNNSERLAIEIPVPLWTAMPNKITNVTATFSRTESERSFSFGAEAFEWWPPSWAFERQNNIKDRLWLYTIRHIGNQDEHIDLWVKVEGY